MKRFKFRINGNIYQVDIHNFEGNLAELEVNGTPYKVELEKEMAVSKTPKLVRAKTPKPTSEAFQPLSSGDKINEVKAPLPGSVLEISVKEGDQVSKEQCVCVMEAMKMENKILAEQAGKVKSIKVNPGDNVLQDTVLMEIE
ncbi:MAG TPA: acetyl-CoA carboxylase biotin carboxyl carrier protein [Cyclobacteriaceae bacterium]